MQKGAEVILGEGGVVGPPAASHPVHILFSNTHSFEHTQSNHIKYRTLTALCRITSATAEPE